MRKKSIYYGLLILIILLTATFAVIRSGNEQGKPGTMAVSKKNQQTDNNVDKTEEHVVNISLKARTADKTTADTTGHGDKKWPPHGKRVNPLPPMVQEKDRYLLWDFIQNNNWEGFEHYLTENNIDINTRYNAGNGFRLFELWISRKPFNRDIMEKIHQMGADFNPPDRNILTNFLLSAGTEGVHFMAEHCPEAIMDQGKKAFIRSSQRGKADTLKALLAEGVDISPSDYPPR